jgi:Ca-activated chloride channel family protein
MLTAIDLESLTFGEPVFLWLLVVPAVLGLLLAVQLLRRRADARRYARRRVLPGPERYTRFGDFAFWLCLLVAASLCIVALARPEARVSAVRGAAADIVILQDGSASMSVNDVSPDRWRRSIQFLRTFANTLSWKGDRVALALFAALAAPQVRLTSDPNALFFFIDHLGDRSPFRLEENPTWDTNIEEGLFWGLQLVETNETLFGKSKNPKAFVVISDGQTWSGDVGLEIARARARQIPVHVIGVGTTAGGLIPEPLGRDGVRPPPVIRSVLDRQSLATIAREGGGDYYELDRESDREIASKIINSVRRRGDSSRIDASSEELYWRFLLAAAIPLCIGTLLLKRGAELWCQALGALAAVLLLVSAMQ